MKMAPIILKNLRAIVIKTIGVSTFIYSLITGFIIEYKMEILVNVIMGTFYKGYIRNGFVFLVSNVISDIRPHKFKL